MHLAALSNDPLGNPNPDLTYEINHGASVRLAKLAQEVGFSRFIFSSLCSTYGAASDDAVAGFSWEEWAGETIAVYEGGLARTKPRRSELACAF